MPVKKLKPQPATRNKTCSVCGEVYNYPEPGSPATRHFCELCCELNPTQRKVLTRMAKRIQSLERTIAQLQKS